MSRPSSRQIWTDIVTLIVSTILLMLLLGYMAGKPGAFLGLIPLTLLIVPAYYVGRFLTTVIHEVGHLVFGKLIGLRFRSMRVGPFVVSKHEGRFDLKRSTEVWGGQIHMTPKDDKPRRVGMIL